MFPCLNYWIIYIFLIQISLLGPGNGIVVVVVVVVVVVRLLATINPFY